MSRIQKFLDGALVPSTRLGGDALLARPATEFVDLFKLNTGKGESQWVGKKLIELSVQNGEWHGVPWRMLRNEFMQLSPSVRLLLCREKTPPLQEVKEQEFEILGDPYFYERSLYIGLQDMLKRGMTIRTNIDGEAYFFPTDNLLARTYRVDANGRPLDLAQA